MSIEIPNDQFRLSMQNPVTGEWETITPIAGAIYNPRTGASTGLKPIACEGTFELSQKCFHRLSRPRGMSHAHWRKVRRERRLDRPFDITVLA